MDPAELEREVDAALRALPTPSAPPSLVARVMTDVRAGQAVRHGLRPWFAWDPRAQVGAALAVMVVASTIGWFAASIVGWINALSQSAPVVAARVVWRAAEPVVTGASVYLVVMGLVVACVTVALTHVAFEGTSNS